MSENPYNAPEPVEEQDLRPAWRRFSSLPLLIIGVASLAFGVVDAVAICGAALQRLRNPGEVIIRGSLCLVVGAVMLWAGKRLRK